MKILILNAGSSSLKYQLIDMDGEKLLAKGLVERIGIEGSHINQKVNGQIFDAVSPMANHTEGIQWMLKALLDPEKGALKSMDEIGAVGHRVLHGGERFTASVLVNEEVKEAIKANIPLGPLHNPANLMGIEACEKVMPGTPNVAVFDTAFHQTMPPKAYLYGVPMEYYEKLHVRRYGFHGTSHRYVSKRVCEFLGVDRAKTRVITCHLGNGSSMCAVENGKCIDTSMGITPLEGVIMGTRSGSMDPAVVQYICNNEHISVDEMLTICNKKSGLLGISGLSSDMRDIDKAADEGNERAIIARDMLVYGIRKYIGSYAAAMNGVDVIVFTAGIGENNCALRERVMKGFEYLGAKLDPAKNAGCREEAVISTDDSKVKICVIPTDEEIVIARDTLCIVTGKPIE
ncbi:MAG: acetate kinase [Candidatus Limiplasma sp.]|jgi:acetate kinase|nr:acetate kinase [Clostridiales bacterium]MDY3243563.1 acetate kinase [Candidatus Limiplasma sp.]MDY4062116.1 acetate kinase [Candidatus Limiplasma sp.]